MTYSEVVALLTSSVHGVRKAVYGVQVRECIARSMEAVIEMVRLGIDADERTGLRFEEQCRRLGEKRRRVEAERGRIESIGQPVGSQCEPERGKWRMLPQRAQANLPQALQPQRRARRMPKAARIRQSDIRTRRKTSLQKPNRNIVAATTSPMT